MRFVMIFLISLSLKTNHLANVPVDKQIRKTIHKRDIFVSKQLNCANDTKTRICLEMFDLKVF
jgi:hypothetical protein